jgi:enterochelin esterase-like enzyme
LAATASGKVARLGARLLAVGGIVAGLVGAYSYVSSYYADRGFPAPRVVKGAAPGRLLTVHFQSAALRRGADYLVYLPPGYSRRTRYPTLYLLHGSPGSPQGFPSISHIQVRVQNLLAQRRMPPMIIVLPDGQIRGNMFSDSEWANTPAGDYESYVLDVVGNVDHRFTTDASRSARVIAGLSSGGYGALNIALHHLPVFGSVQVWSGFFTESRIGVFAHATSQAFAYDSPAVFVRRLGAQLARLPLNVFLYAGRQSRFGPTLAMAHELAAHGAHVAYAIYPGGHDWQLWNAHFNQMLVLAGKQVRPAPAVSSRSPRRHRPRSRHR